MYICLYVYLYICVCLYTYKIYTYIYEYIYSYMHMYMYTYICIMHKVQHNDTFTYICNLQIMTWTQSLVMHSKRLSVCASYWYFESSNAFELHALRQKKMKGKIQQICKINKNVDGGKKKMCRKAKNIRANWTYTQHTHKHTCTIIMIYMFQIIVLISLI